MFGYQHQQTCSLDLITCIQFIFLFGTGRLGKDSERGVIKIYHKSNQISHCIWISSKKPFLEHPSLIARSSQWRTVTTLEWLKTYLRLLSIRLCSHVADLLGWRGRGRGRRQSLRYTARSRHLHERYSRVQMQGQLRMNAERTALDVHQRSRNTHGIWKHVHRLVCTHVLLHCIHLWLHHVYR